MTEPRFKPVFSDDFLDDQKETYGFPGWNERLLRDEVKRCYAHIERLEADLEARPVITSSTALQTMLADRDVRIAELEDVLKKYGRVMYMDLAEIISIASDNLKEYK